MHSARERKILRAGERHTRGCDTLDRGVVRKVRKKNRSFDCSRLLEIVYKILRLFESYAYGGEYDGEFTVGTPYFRLSCNLRGELRVRQTAH